MNGIFVGAKEKIVHIHNPNYTDGVLTLKDGDWQLASRKLNGVALKLYLYLASKENETAGIVNISNVTVLLGYPSCLKMVLRNWI